MGRDARTAPLCGTTLAQGELVLGGTGPGAVSVRGNLARAYRRIVIRTEVDD